MSATSGRTGEVGAERGAVADAQVHLVRRSSRLIPALLSAILVLGACSADEKILYRERDPFNPPPDAANGFLGYYDVAAKQTTCGNCHVDYQAQWQTTAHAGAQATLAANSYSNPTCYSCHTVTGKGNAVGGTTAGHDAKKVAAYFDVQCESCHGPGLAHVEGVSQGNLVRPLAKLSMAGTGTCGDCHSGAHQPFAEEWAASRHSIVEASRATNASCNGCHEGRKALEKWGIDANFVEKAGATAYQPTTCGVCHDPHGSANPSQLRYPISDPDPENNLCMKCHLRRAEPSTTASSPHAPQGAVLLGFAGWRPPGFAYDTARIYGSHATERNPKLCAGCHIAKFTVTDQLTGAFVLQATGHLMRPIPCLDAEGRPTAIETCAYTTTARSWQTCTTAGCHANADVAAGAFATIRSRMKFYTDQLWIDTNVSGSIQSTPTDAGLLATLKGTRASEWSTTDLVITPAEGAEFNTRLCGEYGQSNSDNSKGIHNPFLCEALLISTINYLKSYYALPAPNHSAQLDGPIGGEFNGSMHISRVPAGN